MSGSFLIKVNGDRLMRVTPLESFEATGDNWVPVDVRDTRTRMESQAIVAESLAGDPLALMADSQMRACVRSVWMNATTTWENNRIARNGDWLPDLFPIEVQTPSRWDRAGVSPDEDGNLR